MKPQKSTPSVFFQKRSVNIEKTHQLHRQKMNFGCPHSNFRKNIKMDKTTDTN
jgi:hypothetical protein